MGRSTRTRAGSETPGGGCDRLFLDTDLAVWAGTGVARGGRKSALLGQVEALRLVEDGRRVEATVRDRGPAPYSVELEAVRGELRSRCNCAESDNGPCKHAVAAVEALRFPRPPISAGPAGVRRAGRTARGRGRIVQQPPRPKGWVLTRDERVLLARETELDERRRRARKEQAAVRRLPGHGGPPRFRVSGSGPDGRYLVVLRGGKAELGSCTCPDYAKSELGTCKHIERARNWFARKRKRLPKSVCSVWWRPRPWQRGLPEPLQEIRVTPPQQASLDGESRGYFDVHGWLRPAPRGRPGAAWARAAVDAVRIESERRGWRFDLDQAVERCLEEADQAEARELVLRGVESGNEVWRRIVPHLGLRLHPYQENGVWFLARTGRAFLADDMGLGKTVQAIAAALLLREIAAVSRVLVVCPASLKHQWREEIERTCNEPSVVLDASRAERNAAYKAWRKGFLVLNYELVLRDLERIRACAPDLIILDEAQRIKNWDTKTAKAVKRLASPFAFILTGTPLENRLVELHSLVEFLYPRALGPRWRLFPFHAVTDDEGRVLAYEGLDVLRERLEPFFLRRERDTVIDQLPERTDNTFWTPMTSLQRRAYRRHAARVASLLSKGSPLSPADVRTLLQGLTNMRILCNAYAQYAWDRYADQLRRPENAADLHFLHSPKLEEAVRVLEELLEQADSKIVVFSQWERMLRLAAFSMRPLLLARGERCEVFHGGLNSLARRRLLEEFRTDGQFRVLLSTDAGGLGLNLQDAASIIVNLEVPWNPAVLEQRIGRVHRLGQRRGVQVLHFVTKGAIEERVRQVVENKKALFEGLLVDEADRVVIQRTDHGSLVEQVQRLMVGSGGPQES